MPTNDPNFALDLIENIEKNTSWGSRAKCEIRFDDAGNLHIYVNRHISKYVQLHQDIDVVLQLAPTAEFVKHYDFSTNTNGTRTLVPSLFEVWNETQTNLWYLAHRDDRDSKETMCSTNPIIRATTIDKKSLTLRRCTGYHYCDQCTDPKPKRTRQIRRQGQTLTPMCYAHKEPVPMVQVDCQYSVLRYENVNLTNNVDFGRVVARFGRHSQHCITLCLRAAPSHEAFLKISKNAMHSVTPQAFTNRSFDNDNARAFLINNVSPYFKAKGNVAIAMKKVARQEKQSNGYDARVSQYNGFRVFGHGVPEYLHGVDYCEVEESINKAVIMQNEFMLARFVDEINDKECHDFFDVENMEEIMDRSTVFLHSEMPLQLSSDASWKKVRGCALLAIKCYFESVRKALSIVYMICFREHTESYLALWGVMLSRCMEIEEAPPLATMLRSFLCAMDLDASSRPAFLLAVYLLVSGKWAKVRKEGVIRWWSQVSKDQSKSMIQSAKQFLAKHSIRIPIIIDRLHGSGVFRTLSGLLAKQYRQQFCIQGWALTQLRNWRPSLRLGSGFLQLL